MRLTKALFEGLIFGGAYLRGKSIELALQLEVNLPSSLCFSLYLRTIFQAKAPGGLIFGGVYTRRGLFLEFCGIF